MAAAGQGQKIVLPIGKLLDSDSAHLRPKRPQIAHHSAAAAAGAAMAAPSTRCQKDHLRPSLQQACSRSQIGRQTAVVLVMAGLWAPLQRVSRTGVAVRLQPHRQIILLSEAATSSLSRRDRRLAQAGMTMHWPWRSRRVLHSVAWAGSPSHCFRCRCNC